eukprot:7938670-Pyramimonas_sp.AAC.1
MPDHVGAPAPAGGGAHDAIAHPPILPIAVQSMVGRAGDCSFKQKQSKQKLAQMYQGAAVVVEIDDRPMT